MITNGLELCAITETRMSFCLPFWQSTVYQSTEPCCYLDLQDFHYRDQKYLWSIIRVGSLLRSHCCTENQRETGIMAKFLGILLVSLQLSQDCEDIIISVLVGSCLWFWQQGMQQLMIFSTETHPMQWVLSQLFHSPLSLSSRGSLVLHFLP